MGPSDWIAVVSAAAAVASLVVAISTRVQLAPRVLWRAWADKPNADTTLLHVEAINERNTPVSVRLDTLEVHFFYSARQQKHDEFQLPAEVSGWTRLDGGERREWVPLPASDLRWRVQDTRFDTAVLHVRTRRRRQKVRVEFVPHGTSPPVLQ